MQGRLEREEDSNAKKTQQFSITDLRVSDSRSYVNEVLSNTFLLKHVPAQTRSCSNTLLLK